MIRSKIGSPISLYYLSKTIVSGIKSAVNANFELVGSERFAHGDSDFLGFSEIFDDFVDQSEKDVTLHTTYSRGVTHFSIDRQKDKNFANHRKSGAPQEKRFMLVVIKF